MRYLLVGLLLAFGSMASAQVPEALIGRWAGASIENGTPRLFELDFARDSTRALQATVTLPYNGYDRFPVAFEVQADPQWRYPAILTAELLGDEMRLFLDADEGHLRGTVTTADSVTARVFLQKVVAFDLPAIETEEVRFVSGRDTLAGSLIRPAGPGPHPAAVLVQGRGYGSRSETAQWGRLLARNGVAALAFDGPGTGRSTGTRNVATAESRTADVHAALDLMLAQGDIGPVGLWSYSAGGWIVPEVAADRPGDVAFVITMVGPATGLAEQQGHVTQAFMRASGQPFTPDEYAAAYAYQKATVDLAQAGLPWSSYQQINPAARAARWAEHALIPESLGDADLDYFRRRRGFRAPRWEQVQAPVLAVFGEEDPIVPYAENVPELRRRLLDNPDATVVVLRGLDHSLARPPATVGEGAWPDRYYRPWTRGPAVFETLIGWLRERFVTPDSP
jgi:pimeloyl-ACP methyl ester carboxylesterase